MKKLSIPIALMAMLDWLVSEPLLVAGWRFASTRPGGQSATMHGEMMTVVLLAVSLVFSPMVGDASN